MLKVATSNLARQEMEKALSENWGPFASWGADVCNCVAVVLKAGILLRIIAPLHGHRRDVVRTADVMQAQNIRQGEGGSIDVVETIQKPQSGDIAHPVTIVTLKEVVGVPILEIARSKAALFEVVTFTRPQDVMVHLGDLMINLVLIGQT